MIYELRPLEEGTKEEQKERKQFLRPCDVISVLHSVPRRPMLLLIRFVCLLVWAREREGDGTAGGKR
jgi:hypothetical protein